MQSPIINIPSAFICTTRHRAQGTKLSKPTSAVAPPLPSSCSQHIGGTVLQMTYPTPRLGCSVTHRVLPTKYHNRHHNIKTYIIINIVVIIINSLKLHASKKRTSSLRKNIISFDLPLESFPPISAHHLKQVAKAPLF
jgi:hypothetical protein